MQPDHSPQTVLSAPVAGSPVPAHAKPLLDRPDTRAASSGCPVERVQLGRIVMLAAETGARFERDAIGADPAAWMVAPRRLFGGVSAVEACREERAFLRGMLLHGLSAGLDAEPELLDRLIGDEVEDRDTHEGDLSPPSPPMDLYTATVAYERASSTSHIFYACMAFGLASAARELDRRVGMAAARQARVRRGFDPSDPIALENVSPAIGAVLLEVAADPKSPLGQGLNILIEHRFQY